MSSYLHNSPLAHVMVVNGLRAAWIIVVLWYEVYTFDHVLHDCQWPDIYQADAPNARIARVLVVADPQIVDYRSYPMRNSLMKALGQFIIDLNLRRSWHSTINRVQPHAVVFLGDLMDNGRATMSNSEYDAYAARFFDIFKLRDLSMPTFFLPGNHDLGLGEEVSFSLEARTRYTSNFGPWNHKTTIGNHTVLFIDAVALVEEDVVRADRGYSYDNWPAVAGGSVDFVKRFAAHEHASPVVLFTHIPLARPLDADCGPLRERGTIRQGHGLGYQNTLSNEASQFLLRLLGPSLILSGDDHDYCEYSHPLPFPSASGSTAAREITVKSFSMAMGIRRPGFQLLSLISTVPAIETLTQLPNSPPSLLDTPCFLPDQLGIYLNVYLPFILLSVLSLLAFNIYRTLPGDKKRAQRQPVLSLRPSHSSCRTKDDELYRRSAGQSDTEDTDEDPMLPLPVTKPAGPVHSLRGRSSSSPNSWAFYLLGQRRRILLSLPCSMTNRGVHEVGLLRGFFSDVVDVAWPPLLAFCIAAWCTTHV
ncbi:Metallo-dependent phosphatase-like protein [Suillus subalutaceus]|uniref:Metallo-dependent phosphatase-like protein n=1 Tax=Suillus subalutaceus TaxID=48586 RepID=UPI001B85C3AA|nr:Metallo-dependent phosphatase-like protein [Suillus subalutaceus]KAG1855740.1 Metallo-dependent phosphatase-like protein [Suillus subalutaceus]